MVDRLVPRALGALLALVIGCGHLGAATPEESPGLVEGGAPPDLFLLYTGDVIGYVDPCG